MISTTIRNNWALSEIQQIMQQPFADLLFQAQSIHREHFDPNKVQISTLLSVKTGACPEDCSYCPQSARYNTEVEREKLLPLNEVIKSAQAAKDNGVSEKLKHRAKKFDHKKIGHRD